MKLISFKTFKRYCRKNQLDAPYCCDYRNKSSDCKPSTCPVWIKLKGVK
jgi:hypothetical protein